VRLPARHPALFFIAILCASAAVAALALWIFSRAHSPFDYMVVGTLLAAVALAGVYGFLIVRKWL